MTPLASLWLPVLVAAVLVFVASSIIHMATPWHHGDFSSMPQQARVMDALRSFDIAPGDYVLPRPANRQEMASQEFTELARKGPMVTMTVMPPGGVVIAKNLMMWFVYCLVVGACAGYIAGAALPADAASKKVFQLVGASAFVGYALAHWKATIWYRRSWLTSLKSTIDGFVYGVVTAAAFVWLWPR